MKKKLRTTKYILKIAIFYAFFCLNSCSPEQATEQALFDKISDLSHDNRTQNEPVLNIPKDDDIPSPQCQGCATLSPVADLTDGHTNSRPLVTWNATAGVASYEVWLAQQCGLPAVNAQTTTAPAIQLQDVAPGTHQLCLLGRDTSNKIIAKGELSLATRKGWYKIQSPPGFPKTGWPGMVRLKDKIYIHGGSDLEQFQGNKKTAAYDLKTGEWESLPEISAPLGLGVLVGEGDNLYVIGSNGNTTFPFARYEINTQTWTYPFEWEYANELARGAHAVATSDDSFFVFAGVRFFRDRSSDFVRIDKGFTTVTSLDPGPVPANVYYHQAVWSGTKMYVVTGLITRDHLEGLYAYEPVSDSWEQLASPPFGKRAFACSTWMKDRLFVFGGNNTHLDGDTTIAKPSLRDGAIYDPNTDTWEPVSGQNGPAITRASACAWTGVAVLHFGGSEWNFLLTAGDASKDAYLYYP